MIAPTDPIPLALVALGAFLLGSVPFALLIGLAKGTDIRTVGSKNPGATNLGRTFGFKWFLLCFALDATKGLAPTLAFGLLTGLASGPAMDPAAASSTAIVAATPPTIALLRRANLLSWYHEVAGRATIGSSLR